MGRSSVLRNRYKWSEPASATVVRFRATEQELERPDLENRSGIRNAYDDDAHFSRKLSRACIRIKGDTRIQVSPWFNPY